MKPSSSHILRRMLSVIALDQTYTTLALPVVTFIFFDPASRIFASDTPLTTRATWYGICISMPYFINLFFAPFLSSLSDEVGRKRVLMFEVGSAFTYCLLAGLGVLLGQLWLVIASYVVRGAFSRTNTTALSIIGDVAGKTDKIKHMSNLQLAISIGACLGPMIGGFIAMTYFTQLNFSAPFFLAALLASVNFITIFFVIAETLSERNSDAFAKETARKTGRVVSNLLAAKYVVTHSDVLFTSLILLLIQISWSTYYQFISPLLKNEYGFDARHIGMFMSMVSFWLIIASGPVFRLLHKRFTPHRLITIGASMVLFGYVVTLANYFHLIPGSAALWFAAAPIAMGDVLTYICLTTLYSNLVPEYMQGKVMGINFIVIGLVWGLSGLLGGLLMRTATILPLLVAPLGVFCALLVINAENGKELVTENT